MNWDPCHAARLQSKCLFNTPRTSTDMTTPSCPKGSEPTRLNPGQLYSSGRSAQTLRTACLLDSRPLQAAPPSRPRGLWPFSPLPCSALSGCHLSLVDTVASWQVRCTSLASWRSAHLQSLGAAPTPTPQALGPGARSLPVLLPAWLLLCPNHPQRRSLTNDLAWEPCPRCLPSRCHQP